MAKKNSPFFQHVWVLFTTATLVLSAGWLMKSFPILIFIGISPLFAISEIAKEKESPWNHLELILLSLVVSLFCASFFDTTQLIIILAQAILMTIAFGGYSFAYQNLGSRLGKFTIIFLWLGLEYLMLKLPWRNDFHFLADSLALKTDWWRWTNEVGYLAVSLWVLVANLIFYLAIYKSPAINWFFIAISILFVAGPIVYSIYYLDHPGINREQMMALYDGDGIRLSIDYQDRGELITRTAAWVSILILLLAFVKNKIKKK
jgi:hypothetical protein